MNQERITKPFKTFWPRSYLTIDVYPVPMVFDRRNTKSRPKPIDVPMYTAKEVIELQECTRDFAIENLIYQATGYNIRAYDDAYARSVTTVARRTGRSCGTIGYNDECKIVLPDRRLLSGLWYFICIFELVFLSQKDIKEKHFNDRVLVYAINCLIKLHLLDINAEFYKQDHEEIKPKEYTGIQNKSINMLYETPMHMVYWPKAVYRYYRRFKNILQQKYNSEAVPFIKIDSLSLKPEWNLYYIVNEYTELAASLVNLRFHNGDTVTEEYADVRPTKNNIFRELGIELMRIFDIQKTINICTNPYQFIYASVKKNCGHVNPCDIEAKIYTLMRYNNQEKKIANVLPNTLSLYHELGHLIYPPAISRKSVTVSSRSLQINGSTGNNPELQAEKFAIWCTLKNGYRMSDIAECYTGLANCCHITSVMFRYTRFLTYLNKKYGKIKIPKDIRNMFL